MKFNLDLKSIIKQIQTMPLISIHKKRIREVLSYKKSPISDIYLVITIDFLVFSRILRKINKEFIYDRKITTITDAILSLGFNTLRCIALEIYDSLIVSKEKFGCSFLNFEKYWSHSIAVGLFSKKIAQHLYNDQEMIEKHFVYGTFHDIGKVVLFNLLGKYYTNILEKARSNSTSLCDAETDFMGFNHTDLGSLLAKEWNLPNVFSEVSLYHHAPEKSSQEYRSIVYSVALSNALVNFFKIGFSGNSIKPEIPSEWLKFLNLDMATLTKWKDEVINEIYFFVSFLNSN